MSSGSPVAAVAVEHPQRGDEWSHCRWRGRPGREASEGRVKRQGMPVPLSVNKTII